MTMKHGWSLMAFAITAGVFGQSPLEKAVIDEGVRKIYAADRNAMVAKHKGNKDVMIRTGLVANRITREVRILAFATGNVGDYPLEYVLVGEKGKAYESLAVTLAKASDIHAAMEFVGMTAGHTIRREVFQLWSKGDTVDIRIGWTEKGARKDYRVQDVLSYPDAKETVDSGWIFTGSYRVDHQGKNVYVADDTGDVISTFNSPWTVFDLAAGAGQKEIYGNVTPSKKYTVGHQHRLEFVIKPKLKKGETRNVDYTLALGPETADATLKSGDDLRFTLSETKTGKTLVDTGKLVPILKELSKVSESGKLAYATLSYDKSLPIGAMRDFVQVLHRMTDKGLIRIEPTKGQIFYQALTPNESWRDPNSRPGQPLEFILPKKGGPISFRYYDEEYLDTGRVKLSEWKKTFTTDAELKNILKLKEDWLTQAVLFYGNSATTIGEIQHLHDIVVTRCPIGFIFIDK